MVFGIYEGFEPFVAYAVPVAGQAPSSPSTSSADGIDAAAPRRETVIAAAADARLRASAGVRPLISEATK